MVCGATRPSDVAWICSRTKGHRGEHKAYWGHETTSRNRLYDSWSNTTGRASKDDVAEVLASITATMTKRGRPQDIAARVENANKALAKTHNDSNVSIQIHVGTDNRAELDSIIERLTALRDSL